MAQRFQRAKNIFILMGIYMKIGWKPLEVHNISTISTTFLTTTTTDVRRSTCYWTVDGESGDKAFFCRVQAIRITSTN
jgi:hypothetical protein